MKKNTLRFILILCLIIVTSTGGLFLLSKQKKENPFSLEYTKENSQATQTYTQAMTNLIEQGYKIRQFHSSKMSIQFESTSNLFIGNLQFSSSQKNKTHVIFSGYQLSPFFDPLPEDEVENKAKNLLTMILHPSSFLDNQWFLTLYSKKNTIVRCTNCQKSLRVPIKKGRTIRISCPSCQTQFDLKFTSPLTEVFQWKKETPISENVKLIKTRFSGLDKRSKLSIIWLFVGILLICFLMLRMISTPKSPTSHSKEKAKTEFLF